MDAAPQVYVIQSACDVFVRRHLIGLSDVRVKQITGHRAFKIGSMDKVLVIYFS